MLNIYVLVCYKTFVYIIKVAHIEVRIQHVVNYEYSAIKIHKIVATPQLCILPSNVCSKKLLLLRLL